MLKIKLSLAFPLGSFDMNELIQKSNELASPIGIESSPLRQDKINIMQKSPKNANQRESSPERFMDSSHSKNSYDESDECSVLNKKEKDNTSESSMDKVMKMS